MDIRNRYEPKENDDIYNILLHLEMQRLALIQAIEFIKEVSNNFCFNQSDDDGLKKLVEFEAKAAALLKKFGVKE